jgi:prepilin-type processing-associated H-X9-DG protein
MNVDHRTNLDARIRIVDSQQNNGNYTWVDGHWERTRAQPNPLTAPPPRGPVVRDHTRTTNDVSQSEADADNRVMNDRIARNLSFEDRLEAFLEAIVERFERKIEKQINRITKLQAQEDAGGKAVAANGEVAPRSSDMEMQELARLNRKLDALKQMFEKIINKLDQ